MENLTIAIESSNPITRISIRQHFLYVLLFCTIIAITLSLLLAQSLLNELVISYCFGISILIAFLIYGHYFRFRKSTVVVPLLLGSLVGLIPATLISSTMYGIDISTLAQILPEITSDLTTSLAIALGFGSLVLYFILSKVRDKVASDKLRVQQLVLAESEKQLAQTQLRLLQAQVEPHFLFNTLSNVAAMIETRPSTSRKMLEDLTYYLRSTLTHSRNVHTTLGDEIQLLEHFLAIYQIRMGERLSYTISISPELMSCPLPPMLLQPLVENAIMHGLEPSEHGGLINIKAERTDNLLCVSVADTGLGLQAASGSGFGIANIRERLRTLFEGTATLTVKDNWPHGVIAILEVPNAQV